MAREPERISGLIDGLLRRLGGQDHATWTRIVEEWPQAAGPPWDGQARPLSINGGRLVVEALSPAAVAVLRYGLASLEARLAEHFGSEVVTAVELRPPSRRNP